MKHSLFIRPAVWLGIALLTASTTMAQTDATKTTDGDGDPRVKIALESLKYKYTVNVRKNYELTFTRKDNRTQYVFVRSDCEKYNNLEIRDVTSTAYSVKGKFPADLALRFLADNDRRKWGSWRIVEKEDTTYLLYAIQVPADCTPEILDNAMNAVLSTADDVEKELSTKDQF